MSQRVQSVVSERRTLWERSGLPFRLDELHVRHIGPDREPLDRRYVSFERGDSVAALIVNRDTSQVILVDQFRSPTFGKGSPDGRLIEAAAGIIRQNETPLQCLQREVEEETGLKLAFDAATGQLQDTELIAEFYPSPGGCSERIYLYYVEVHSGTPQGAGGGIAKEGEFVETVVMRVEELFERVRRHEIKDAKIVMAAYWLMDRIRNRKVGWSLQQHELQEFGIEGVERKIVGYRCGDVYKVRDVDVWVNSENVNFWMDRLHGESLSSRIRTLGARTEDGKIVEDTIQEALVRKLAIGAGLDLGNVLETPAGALEKSHNVRLLLHAAGVKPDPGREKDGVPVLTTDIDAVTLCVANALRHCDAHNGKAWGGKPYTSIIFPLLGAGVTRLLGVEQVAQALIPSVVNYLEANPQSKLDRIYFLAYTPIEIELVDRVMTRHPLLKRLA